MRRLTIGPLLSVQRNILVALMLRDIQSRFGNQFGFLIAIAWPLSHILLLLILNGAAGRIPPYGDSGLLWFSTGIVPFMAFSYMARSTMLGVILNRPLLSFPMAKIMDIVFARAIIEVLNASVVIIVLIMIFVTLGIDFAPLDVTQAFFAVGASMLLGLGVGVVNSIIAAAAPLWATGYALLNIVMWLTAGVFFVPDALPKTLLYLVSFNPMTHGVAWLRSAYFDGYGSAYLSKAYMVEFAACNLFFGLLLERLVRGKLLQN